MLLKTLLNKVEKFKSFIYRGAIFWWFNGEEAILVTVVSRKNSWAICSECGERGTIYDTSTQPRYFEYVPLWKWKVYFEYRMRRVNCRTHGVTVEKVPWADGKHAQTRTLQVFLARWARRLSWKETAEIFGTSWDSVVRAVRMVVDYGVAHRNLAGITQIGIDEIAVFRGHKYLTLVYQINAGTKRLLWVGKDRTKTTLRRFFKEFGQERIAKLEFIVTDMWPAYLNVIAAKASHALQILDRFHIMKKMNEAIDLARREDSRALRKKHGKDHVLVHSRWALLKRVGRHTRKQRIKLGELLRLNLKTVKAYLLREDFQQFWDSPDKEQASWFLDDWIRRVNRTSIQPMKKVAETLREHRSLILNWFEARGLLALGAVEGLNTRCKLTIRKAFGFKTVENVELQLYHVLGHLPEPPITHRFC